MTPGGAQKANETCRPRRRTRKVGALGHPRPPTGCLNSLGGPLLPSGGAFFHSSLSSYLPLGSKMVDQPPSASPFFSLLFCFCVGCIFPPTFLLFADVKISFLALSGIFIWFPMAVLIREMCGRGKSGNAFHLLLYAPRDVQSAETKTSTCVDLSDL